MIAFAALAVASCSKMDDMPSSQSEIDQNKYDAAFKKYLLDGKSIAPNQTWGFSADAYSSAAPAFSRAASLYGWEVSSGYDATFTKEYFDAIQEVMPEQVSTTANSDYEFLSSGPFEFSIIFSNTSASNEVGYYYYKASDGIASRTEVKFIDSSDSPVNYFQYAQPNWAGETVWNTPQAQSGFQIWDWGATQVRAKVFTINVPAGYRVGFYIENKSAGYPRTYSNKSLNEDGEAYSAVVEQVSGTLAGTFLVGLEDWKRDQGGDNDCNDIIFSVNKGTTPPVVIVPDDPDPDDDSADLRIIAEDLSATGASDFDFNDVVLDVTYGSPAKVVLVAAGGTLPLRINGDDTNLEVHKLFGVWEEGAEKQTMVNTGRGASLPSVDISSKVNVSIANAAEANTKLKLEVYKNGEWQEMKAPQGEPACKLAVDPTFTILPERTSIKDEYPLFVEWATGTGFTSKWW